MCSWHSSTNTATPISATTSATSTTTVIQLIAAGNGGSLGIASRGFRSLSTNCEKKPSNRQQNNPLPIFVKGNGH